MENLVTYPPKKEDYNLIISRFQELKKENPLIAVLKKMRDESYIAEKHFFEQKLNKEEFKDFFSAMGSVESYLNFLQKQSASGGFYTRILLGRDFKDGEEEFIKFLYSKDLIFGLSADNQLRFSMVDLPDKKIIGSGKSITIKDLLEYTWTQLKDELLKALEAIETEKATIIIENHATDLIEAMLDDLEEISVDIAGTSLNGKTGYQSRTGKKEKIKTLLSEYNFTLEEDISQKTLLVKQDIIDSPENSNNIKKYANLVKVGEKTLESFEEMIKGLMKKKLEENGAVVEDSEISNQYYTPFFINKKEFSKIKFNKSMAYISSLKNQIENNEENQYKDFVDFLDKQLDRVSSKYPRGKVFWDKIKEEPYLSSIINDWGQSYSNGSNIIGHVGEGFAKFYFNSMKEGVAKIYGQSYNKLGQQSHVDIGYNDIGLQVKNYSTVVNKFHFYETDVSVFTDAITRYIGDIEGLESEKIIIQLRFLAAEHYNMEGSKNIISLTNAVKNVLELNIAYWTRYDDFQSNLDNIKNNFFLLNFKLIPASLIFQYLIINIKNNQKTNYFNLERFVEKNPTKETIDLSSESQLSNLFPESGRIIFNGFTFDLSSLGKETKLI